MNKKLIYIAITTLAVALTGCGASQKPAETPIATETPVTETPVTQTPVEEEAGTVKVVHTLGETEVKKNPKNVVVFDYGTLDALDTLGVEVTGIAPSNLPSYLTKYEADTYESVGDLFEPNLEKIFELEPELIIIGGRQADFYEELSKIAPTVSMAVDNTDYLGSFKRNMNYLGEIFGKEEEVATKLAEIDAEIAAVNAKAKEKGASGLIVLANDSAISVYGEGSRFGIIHDEFGVAAADTTIEDSNHGQKATFEYVAEVNPDYIFVVDRAAVAGGETAASKLFDNELVKKTNAYKNDRIIYLHPEAWYVAGGGFMSTQIMVDNMAAALEK